MEDILSVMVCIGCKYFSSIPTFDKYGKAEGGYLYCKWNTDNPEDKCHLSNNGRSAWGSKFELEE